MKPATALLTLGLTACATSAPIHLPDGSMGHNVNCGGAAMNYSHCMAKAGELCGAKGYEIVNREGGAVPFGLASGHANPYQAGFYGQSGMIVSRNILVRCK